MRTNVVKVINGPLPKPQQHMSCQSAWEFQNGAISSMYTKDFNSSPTSAAYMRQWIGTALVQIMACHLFSAKPLSKSMLGYYQSEP